MYSFRQLLLTAVFAAPGLASDVLPTKARCPKFFFPPSSPYPVPLWQSSSSLSRTGKKSFLEKMLPQDAHDIVRDFLRTRRTVKIDEQFLWDGAVTDQIKMMARTSPEALPESMTVPVDTRVDVSCVGSSWDIPPKNLGDRLQLGATSDVLYRCTENGAWVSGASEKLTILTCRHFFIEADVNVTPSSRAGGRRSGPQWSNFTGLFRLLFRREDEGTDFPLTTLVTAVKKAITGVRAPWEMQTGSAEFQETDIYLRNSEHSKPVYINGRPTFNGSLWSEDLAGVTIQLVRSWGSPDSDSEFSRIVRLSE